MGVYGTECLDLTEVKKSCFKHSKGNNWNKCIGIDAYIDVRSFLFLVDQFVKTFSVTKMFFIIEITLAVRMQLKRHIMSKPC